MKFRFLKIFFLYIFFLTFSLFSQETSQNNIKAIHENVLNPTGKALGNTGNLLLFPLASSMQNSAILASFVRDGYIAGGIYNADLLGGWGNYVYTDFLGIQGGNLGISFSFIKSQSSISDFTSNIIDNYSTLKIAYARNINKSIALGFGIKPIFSQTTDSNLFGMAFEPSLIFDSRVEWNMVGGFGIYDLNLYLSSQNLGFFIGDSSDLMPETSVHIGIQSDFYNKGYIRLGMNFEVSSLSTFSNFPLHFGTYIDIKGFRLLGGYEFNSDVTYSALNFGIGYNLPLENGNLVFNYTLSVQDSSLANNNLTHFFSVGGRYGTVDTEAPKIQVKTDFKNISPNWDGKQDYVHFQIAVEDDSPIKNWKLTILDSKGHVIRTFENDKRNIDKKLGIKEIFTHMFKRQESISVPQLIRWDGTGNAVDINKSIENENVEEDNSNNNQKAKDFSVPDGYYTYKFQATDLKHNSSLPVIGKIRIDRQGPQVIVNIDRNFFSPNGDGNFDEFVILQEEIAESTDIWEASIVNEKGKVIKTYSFKGKELPDKIVWKGDTDKKEKAEEGIYRYIIRGRDLAGNTFTYKSEEITLIRRIDVVDVNFHPRGISPNADKLFDSLVIKPYLTTKKDLKDWQIVITESKPDFTKSLQTSLKIWNSENTTGSKTKVPKKITWSGKDKNDQLLPDGTYYMSIQATYNSGNKPHSFPKKVVIDTTPPKSGVEADLAMFSPDGSGKNEEQVFRLQIEDKSELKNFTLQIYEILYDENNKKMRIPFKKFQGKSKYPKKIYWDGKSDRGRLVESVTFYEYELTATDIYGNTEKSLTGRFETDILILVTERGLKIRLSNIEFQSGKANLSKKTKKLLDRLARLLLRYKQYKIKVEGHTDNIGTDVYNLKLSERRAKAIMNYLIYKEIDKNRISFMGMGEMVPLLPNTNKYNRSRNRRAEFILEKK